MTHELICENLVFPLWRCISADFKSKYRSDAWGIFENFLRSAAYCENLKSFLDKFKRLAPVDWQHQFQDKILLVIDSGKDDEVLTTLRTECAYVVLMARVMNEERKQQYQDS